MPDWKDYCPIDEEEWPVQRQAWHAGWMHRMDNGPGLNDEDAEPIARRMIDDYNPSMLSVWLQGYSAADNVQRDELDE